VSGRRAAVDGSAGRSALIRMGSSRRKGTIAMRAWSDPRRTS